MDFENTQLLIAEVSLAKVPEKFEWNRRSGNAIIWRSLFKSVT